MEKPWQGTAEALRERARQENLAGDPLLRLQVSHAETESFNMGMSVGAFVGAVGGFVIGGVIGYVIGKRRG